MLSLHTSMRYADYTSQAVEMLKELIATPSVSRDEQRAADIIVRYMQQYGMEYRREGNNVWTIAPGYDANRPTLLLNAHIDTVKPAATWTRDPFAPTIEGDRLYGLGSNDCGGGLVSLLQVFRILQGKALSYNLVYLASAEEEVSGANGFSLALPLLPKISVAIVGEPTAMQPAIAEKGLMVIDAIAHGKSGHAARNEGINAIYEALDDLQWLRSHQFEEVSPLLGPTKMTVTVINAGTQHNVIPDMCRFTIDVRTNEYHRNEDVFEYLSKHLKSEISENHPIVVRCKAMGMQPFGSPTLSDQALMPFTSLKLGPGDSARSHSADEYICISEIEDAISKYVELLEGVVI